MVTRERGGPVLARGTQSAVRARACSLAPLALSSPRRRQRWSSSVASGGSMGSPVCRSPALTPGATSRQRRPEGAAGGTTRLFDSTPRETDRAMRKPSTPCRRGSCGSRSPWWRMHGDTARRGRGAPVPGCEPSRHGPGDRRSARSLPGTCERGVAQAPRSLHRRVPGYARSAPEAIAPVTPLTLSAGGEEAGWAADDRPRASDARSAVTPSAIHRIGPAIC